MGVWLGAIQCLFLDFEEEMRKASSGAAAKAGVQQDRRTGRVCVVVRTLMAGSGLRCCFFILFFYPGPR